MNDSLRNKGDTGTDCYPVHERRKTTTFLEEDTFSPFIASMIPIKSSNKSHDKDPLRLSPSFSFGSPPSSVVPPKIPVTKKKYKVLMMILIPSLSLLISAVIVSSIYHPVLLPRTRQRPYNINDPRISNPYLTESVSSGGLVAIIVVVAVFVAVCGAIGGPGSIGFGRMHWKRRILALLASVCVTAGFLDVLTISLKVGVAALRPDFLDRCQPDPMTSECTNTDIIVVAEGRVSFPSGHSSWSMYSCMLLSLFLEQLVVSSYHAFKQRGRKNVALSVAIIGSLLSIGVLAPGIVIAASRVTDNRHFVRDVVVGGVFGVVGACGCYLIYRIYSIQMLSVNWKHGSDNMNNRQKTLKIQARSPETDVERDELSECEYKNINNNKEEEDDNLRNILAMIPSPTLKTRTNESLSFKMNFESSSTM